MMFRVLTLVVLSSAQLSNAVRALAKALAALIEELRP